MPMTARRHYLRVQRFAGLMMEPGLVSAFYAKQLEEPGTPLPPDFPALTKLNAAHYFATEDLYEADVAELVREAHLNRFEAVAVLTALGVTP